MFEKNLEKRDLKTVELFKRLNIPYGHYLEFKEVSGLKGSSDFIDKYLEGKEKQDKQFLLHLYNYLDFKNGFIVFNQNINLARNVYYMMLRIFDKLEFKVLNISLKSLAETLNDSSSRFTSRFNDADIIGIDDFYVNNGKKDHLNSSEIYAIQNYLRFASGADKAFLFCGSCKNLETASSVWGLDVINILKSVNQRVVFKG